MVCLFKLSSISVEGTAELALSAKTSSKEEADSANSSHGVVFINLLELVTPPPEPPVTVRHDIVTVHPRKAFAQVTQHHAQSRTESCEDCRRRERYQGEIESRKKFSLCHRPKHSWTAACMASHRASLAGAQERARPKARRSSERRQRRGSAESGRGIVGMLVWASLPFLQARKTNSMQ